eukprot:comp19719_c0_seq1/m.23476 comp19719_c0_seq1/g.23476  ORF comp19719_c0_seq1/g.23476 comp19719_c0_seq1/m.23476 type:complete len:602 (-) comp19719_c0_seq1:653-2458(-)
MFRSLLNSVRGVGSASATTEVAPAATISPEPIRLSVEAAIEDDSPEFAQATAVSRTTTAEEEELLRMMEEQNTLLEHKMRSKSQSGQGSPSTLATPPSTQSPTQSQNSPQTSAGWSPGLRSLLSVTRMVGGGGGEKETERRASMDAPDVVGDCASTMSIGKEVEQDPVVLWATMVSDWESNPKKRKQQAKLLVGQGIPDPLRSMAWQLLASSHGSSHVALYAELVQRESIHEKQIMKDIARTFPEHAFFNDNAGMGQETLFRVTKAFSLHDPEMGYCQGMAFIVGIFLMKMPEEDAFALLIALMENYKLRELFMPGMPLIGLAHYQFKALLAEYLPEVSMCLEREGVHVSSYLTQWLMTMFAVALPLPVVFHVVDLVLATGEERSVGALEVLYRVALAVLAECADDITARTMDGIMTFLRKDLYRHFEVCADEQGPEVNGANAKSRRLIQAVQARHIPGRRLDQLKRGFATEKAAEDARQGRIGELLGIRNDLDSKIKDQERENENLRKMIADENAQVREELARMEKRCEKYDAELANLKKQHRLLVRLLEATSNTSQSSLDNTLDYCKRSPERVKVDQHRPSRSSVLTGQPRPASPPKLT